MTSAHPCRLQSARTTTELYRSCMNLSVEARSLLVQNEGMKRLGLNAQVLASHVGEQGSSLEVIVAEIGQLSASFRESLTSLGEAAKDLSSTAIEVLHLAHLNSSYELGWRRGVGPASVGAYRGVLQSVQERRRSRLEELEEGMGRIESLVDDLDRAARRIPPITTLILIVAAEIRVHTAAIHSTVGDLKAFHAHMETKVDRMADIRAAGMAAIAAIEQEET